MYLQLKYVLEIEYVIEILLDKIVETVRFL